MKLIVFRGRRKVGSAELCDGELIVGRADDCEVQLEDKLVSRRHAILRVDGDTVHIEDLGGAGGLTINEQPAQQARVLAGDRIELGPFTLVLSSSALGIATALDVETLGDFASPVPGPDEETVSMGAIEMADLRDRQRTLMGAHLTLRGPDGSREFPMKPITQTIGFSEDCAIQVPGFGLLNRRLAEVAPDGKGWALVAISRLTPVHVNGTRITRHHLVDGDMIEVRGVKLRFSASLG